MTRSCSRKIALLKAHFGEALFLRGEKRSEFPASCLTSNLPRWSKKQKEDFIRTGCRAAAATAAAAAAAFILALLGYIAGSEVFFFSRHTSLPRLMKSESVTFVAHHSRESYVNKKPRGGEGGINSHSHSCPVSADTRI